VSIGVLIISRLAGNLDPDNDDKGSDKVLEREKRITHDGLTATDETDKSLEKSQRQIRIDSVPTGLFFTRNTFLYVVTAALL